MLTEGGPLGREEERPVCRRDEGASLRISESGALSDLGLSERNTASSSDDMIAVVYVDCVVEGDRPHRSEGQKQDIGQLEFKRATRLPRASRDCQAIVKWF